jgi:hypothetical protein
VTADLRDIQLGSLDVAGGVDSVEIDLPPPSVSVQLRVAVGVSDVAFHRPSGAPLSLHARGGVTALRVDGQRLPSVGSALHWKSPGFHPDQAHYALDVSGGVSGVTVDTR